MNAQKIRDLCKKHRITLKELADKVGMTATGMQHILKFGATNTGTLERIARELGVHPGYFFDDHPIKSDKYGSTSTVPPIVSESYDQMTLADREVKFAAGEAFKQVTEAQAETIKSLKDMIEILKTKNPT
jgi:transcriptional regulator with XRE-family HTH domain